MEQLSIEIPYEFIALKVRLTWREAQFGVHEQLLSPLGARELARDLLGTSAESETVRDLASTEPGDSVVSIIDALATPEPEDTDGAQRLWAYLVLAWVFEHRDRFEDPLDLAEKVYADLGYPEQVAPFVRYMPSDDAIPADQAANETRLYNKWAQYLVDEAAHYSDR